MPGNNRQRHVFTVFPLANNDARLPSGEVIQTNAKDCFRAYELPVSKTFPLIAIGISSPVIAIIKDHSAVVGKDGKVSASSST
ncbi:hypothetical protein ACNKHR_17630 [Shigella flexneri]